MNRYASWRRAVRGLGLGRNPLHRRVDRVDGLVRLLVATLAAVLLVGVTASAAATYRAALERNAVQLRHRHSVNVVLLADTVSSADTPYAPAYREHLPVRARWTDASGVARVGEVYPWRAGRSGDRAAVWFDDAGRPVPALPSVGDLQAQAWTGGLAGVGLGGLVLFAACCTAQAGLNQWRYRAWSAEWAAVAPHWRHNV